MFFQSNLHLLPRTDGDFISPQGLGKFTQLLIITLCLNIFYWVRNVPREVKDNELAQKLQKPTTPWGTNPLFPDNIHHLAHEFPGAKDFHIVRDAILCKKFDTIVKEKNSFNVDVDQCFNLEAKIGDVILLEMRLI